MPSTTLEELFANVLDVDAADLTDASSPASIETWDSVAAINLIVGMQETFNVVFTTKEIEGMKCLGDARRVLMARGKQA